MSTGTDARDRVFELVDGFIADPAAGTQAIDDARASLPADAIADLESVLGDRRISYRDGVLIQLGYGLEDATLDLTRRPEGARGMAQQLGVFLSERHITAVKDAYQNIAKNTDRLARGNVEEFDRLLHWANGVSQGDREAALGFACAAVAATARPVLPMPELNRSALTFARTTGLLLDLLNVPSGGAYEQFAFAALLHTMVASHAADQVRVETKSLNASDRSSFAAGDVQIATGSRVIEAFEITANNWATKIDGASKTIRDNDLSRLHIVANRPEGDRKAASERLNQLAEDVAVLDVRQAVEVLTAVLTRPQRAEALVRLYEYLDRYQPDTERVNELVRRLDAANLVERAGN
ncbi:hypothetical protein ACSSNL_05105 [Thalassobius sp. S69A]|uniref:hypothetical protein n=1 Tax=unclassified Thalassovita TaxID=2619711 RepID=UPI000C0F081D|nr:hypothetical protein [Paracoccaceae bacterium]MBT25860.1 hypothetical protein [Paracoccaceae bacterium]